MAVFLVFAFLKLVFKVLYYYLNNYNPTIEYTLANFRYD